MLAARPNDVPLDNANIFRLLECELVGRFHPIVIPEGAATAIEPQTMLDVMTCARRPLDRVVKFLVGIVVIVLGVTARKIVRQFPTVAAAANN